MNILTLPGPDFLKFYLCFIIFICLATTWLFKKIDEEKRIPLSLDGDLDPYFAAWLKKREEGILQVAIGPLIDNEYLIKEKEGLWVHNPEHSKEKLPKKSLEARILNHFSTARSLSSALHLVKNFNREYHKEAQKKRLVLTHSQILHRRRIAKVGGFLIFGVGLCKLIVALATHHNNVFFLICSIVIASLIYRGRFLTNKKSIILSPAGQNYLSRLGPLINHLENPKAKWLAATLAGTSILSTTAYASSEAYSSSSDSGSGSSCSGSSCSGSSCGGSGCGGCGGD
jgi:uncharacterized protein (TIGR04222 family)